MSRRRMYSYNSPAHSPSSHATPIKRYIVHIVDTFRTDFGNYPKNPIYHYGTEGLVSCVSPIAPGIEKIRSQWSNWIRIQFLGDGQRFHFMLPVNFIHQHIVGYLQKRGHDEGCRRILFAYTVGGEGISVLFCYGIE